MSNLSQFYSARTPPTSLVNGFSTTGFTITLATPIPANVKNIGLKHSLSGSLTADTLATALSVTGVGTLNFLGVSTFDATSRTMRAKLTIDGVVVFDSTSTANTAGNNLIPVIGHCNNGANGVVGTLVLEEVHFRTSFLFEIASSVTETGMFNIYTKYMMY